MRRKYKSQAYQHNNYKSGTLLLIALLMWVMLYPCVESLAACGTAKFPIIFGASQDDSNISTFDYNENTA